MLSGHSSNILTATASRCSIIPHSAAATTLNVMRGFGLNRFLDKGKFLANIEYRFPIWWIFGGNVFVDMGNVWSRLGDIDLGKTVVDYGLGLRLYMKDFTVRVDLGFSKEGSRLYFNFGHIF